jgi:hypothetical protein
MRRSTSLSPPLQLVFPDKHLKFFKVFASLPLHDINVAIFGALSAMAVNQSKTYMVWLRDRDPSAGRMSTASRFIINVLAGTGLPDSFRPYVDPIALMSWLMEEDNYSRKTMGSKMERFLKVSQKVNHLIIRLTDAKSVGDHEPESCAKNWGLELKAAARARGIL